MNDSFDFSAAFKAAVALAAHQGQQSLSDLSQRFGVPPEVIEQWKQELTEHASVAFQRRRETDIAAEGILDSKELAFIIAENSTQGFAIMDEHSYCIYANRAWLDMTGYTVDEIRSQPLHDLVHHHYPDGRPYPLSECPIDRALPENFEVRAHEDVFFRKDGTRFSVLCAASPIFRNGRPVATAIEIRDITESKLAAEREQQLMTDALAAADANAKFRTFFEQGSHFAVVIALDGTVVEANRLCTDGCGFAWRDVIGRQFWSCGWWTPSPALVDIIRDGTLHAAAGRTFEQEIPYFLADGSERMVNLVMSPVKSDTGRILFMAATGVDITNRLRMEQRLRLLDAISEATRDLLDPKAIMAAATRLLGEHLDATRCAYADVEVDNNRFTIRSDWTAPGAASAIGVYSLDLFGVHAAGKMRSGRTLVIQDVDRELTAADGGDMFNAIGVKAIICCPLVREGRLVAMMAVHHHAPRIWTGDDIRLVEQIVERSWAHIERVRSAESLREADRRKTEFLATLAHELRNPLAPIRNGLQVMKLEAGDASAIERTREMMERQLSHMVHLVDDLLDIARINRGQVALKKQRVALGAVVAAAIETNQPLADARGQVLHVSQPAQPLVLDVDANRIIQVIGNLLNNAIKYTPPGGRIDIAVERDGNSAAIKVSDTGMGIPAESIPTLFDMFSQVASDNQHAQGGLGIGLSLVRQLVLLHGGTVSASSPGRNLGSTFLVRLPLADAGTLETPPADDERKRSLRHLRVLVVDDNVDAADTTATLLELTGYAAQKAYDGAQAMQAAVEFHPDAVLLDIGLPDVSGHDLAPKLRALPGMASVLLIALTGWGAEEDRLRSEQAGFSYHLTKPVDLSTIEKILSTHAAWRE